MKEQVKMQKCTGDCGEIKPHTEEFFYRDKTRKSGFSNKCKVCMKAYQKVYTDNTEFIESRKMYMKEYNHRNIDIKKIKKRVAQAEKRKLKEEQQKKLEPINKIKANMSSKFSVLLKRMNTCKPDGTISYTNRTKQELLDHFNSGKYTAVDYMKNTKDKILFHIDHIIPSAYYLEKLELDENGNITPETEPWLYKWWNYRNLRIWPAKDNISKKDKLDMDLIKEYGIEDLLTLV